jgi:hypothetical protein
MKHLTFMLAGFVAVSILTGLTGCFREVVGNNSIPLGPTLTGTGSSAQETVFQELEGWPPNSALVVPGNAEPASKQRAEALKRSHADLIQICDGVNDELQIQAALDALPASGGIVYLANGTFNISAPVTVKSHISLRGSNSTIIRSTIQDDSLFTNTAGYSNLTTPLLVDLKAGSVSLAVSDTSRYAVNDWIKITDDTIIGGGNIGKQGELARIKSIEVNTITLDRPVVFSYQVARSAHIRKITFTENVSFSGLRLIGPGINTRSHLMDLITVSGFSLEGCSVENFGIAGVILTDSMHARIKDNNFKNIYEYGMGYPILLHNASEKILIINNTFSGKANHHIAQGARTGEPGNGGIVRSVEIINNKFEGSVLAAIDAHTPYHGPLIVRENYFSNCFNGISAYNAYLEASGNTFENCAVGINVPPGTETRSSLIINNTIIGGVYGVKVKSPNVDIMYNRFINCGIYAVGVARTINITGNSFTPSDGDTVIFEGTPLD